MKSLKVALTLWLSLLFFCVMLALAVGLGIQEIRHTTHDVAVYLRQMTQMVSDMVQEKQTSIFNYLSRVALQIPEDPKEAEAYIRKLGFSYLPVSSSFYLLDARGRICIVFRKSLKAFKGMSLMNLEDVKSVITTRRPTISRIYVSPFSGRRVVSMNFPGSGKWILRVDISTDLFIDLLKNVQKVTKIHLYIFNKRGDIFEHPQQKFPGELAGMGLMTDQWREMKEATGHLLHFRFSGEKMVGIFMPLNPFGLIVGTVLPASYITQKMIYSLIMLGGVGLISLLVLAAINFWMILHFVIHPIEEISTRVGRYEIGKGALSLPLNLGSGFRELNLLVEKFNQMSGRIHMHVREIARLESMIRNILDSSPAIIIALDPHGRIWYMNKSGETFFGTTSKQVMGKKLRDLDSELEACEQRVKDVLHTSEPSFSRAQNWLRGTMVDRAIYPLVSDGIEGIVVQWLDVSERYRVQETYRKRLEEIFSQMGDLIYVVNENYEIEIMNEEQAKRTKRRRDGGVCYSVIKGRDDICPDCQFDEIKKGKVIRERILNPVDGRYYDVLSIPLFNEDGSISKLTISRDVTEYVAIQEALKASESAFRSLFEGAPIGMSVHQEGKFVMVNEAFGKIVGYMPRELIDASILKIVHPDEKGYVRERLKRIYQQGKLADVARERYLRKDGTMAEVLVTGIPINYHGKRAVHTVVIDLTEQIRLQTFLLRSEEFSAQILEKALDPILVLKPETLEILEANHPATQFFGLSHEELIGRNYIDFVSEGDIEKVKENIKSIRKEGFLSVTERHFDLPGGKRITNLSITRLKTPQGEERNVVFIRDLTEFIALQQRLAQAQKQESLWQMAGGFAHDFNNLLAIMFGYIDMMELNHDIIKHEEYVRKLREISLRARDLVQNILLFSRENRGEQRACTVNEVIFSALNLVRPSLGRKIELKVEILNPNDVILVDVSQMIQVILNLALNARDAIGERKAGVVSILTGRRKLNKADAKVRETAPGLYVEFSVADTGTGIPQRIQDKIFDPFFTTKSKGTRKGTGLGLAIVHSIVKNFKGCIELETSRKGTTFRVLIPLEEEGIEESVEIRKDTLIAGKGKILVVEDEHTLQILLQEMLEELGYEVESVGDGITAVEKLKEGYPGLNVVIMDLAMPKMGGEEALSRMLEIRPDLRVVIMSGLVDDETQKRLLKKGAMAFVKKPVTISKLSQVIHGIIQKQ
jgi:PAS domain S-box-containing protein